MLRWGDELLDAAEAGDDPEAAVRLWAQPDNQLALVDIQGRVGVHTGSGCPGHAGHATADDVSAQANLAALPDAWHRMVAAYAETAGPMAERLVAALAASGGDVRGRQAAAVMVTGGTPGDDLAGFWFEPHVDLRVDGHHDPVPALARLLSLHRAHNEMRRVANLHAPDRLEVLRPLLAAHPDDPQLTRAANAAQQDA